MLINYGKGNKKVPLSRCSPPDTGSGCINTPHGGRNPIRYIAKAMDIKNARSKVIWRAFARLYQMENNANMRIYFGIAKEKAETF